jgi:hypothetical protein
MLPKIVERFLATEQKAGRRHDAAT